MAEFVVETVIIRGRVAAKKGRRKENASNVDECLQSPITVCILS